MKIKFIGLLLLTISQTSTAISMGQQGSATQRLTVDIPENIERIEVLGQKTKPQLLKEFQLAKFEFIDLFNQINEEKKYDVICAHRRPVGTKIAVKECESRFIKEERYQAIQLAFNLTKQGSDSARTPSAGKIKFHTERERKRAYMHLANLISENAELKAQWHKLEALQHKLSD